MDKAKLGIKKGKPKDLFAVIFGGRGKEREISVLGGLSFIKEAAKLGYGLLPIYIAPDGRFLLYEGDPQTIDSVQLDRLRTEAYPVRLSDKSGFLISDEVVPVKSAMIILHGDYGEDGTVQGALETAGIDYIGAGVAASAVALDKYFTKCVAVSLGIPVLDFKAYSSGVSADAIEKDIGYPIFIKPRALGSSIGASPAASREELDFALAEAFCHTNGIIAERCLPDKRELEAAYFSLGGTTIVTSPGEVELGGGFYSYGEKYSENSSARLSLIAEVPEKIRDKIKDYTLRLAEALEIRHFARFDYFLSGNELYFNEVNTLPGMTDKSMFLAMLRESGMDFSAFLLRVFGEEP